MTMPASKKSSKIKPAPKTTAKTTKKTVSRPAAKRAAPAKVTPAPALQSPPERLGVIEVGGKPATVIGADVQVGQKAPHFKAQVGAWAGQDTWAEVDPLEATRGLVRIVAAVPSLDTSTCDLETRRFNVEAAQLGAAVRIITISADLPVAQKRWCGAAGIDKVVVVSDHMAGEFGIAYGALIKERRWLRRAVFVVDQNDVIRYAAYMAKSSDQPDYEAVLAAARQLVAA
jgi:thioredoxin-dependent peroxiredoxin